jgi:hypothetical protein
MCLYSCLRYPARRHVCLTLQYFSTLFHKPRDFRKTLFNTKSVFLLSVQILYETFLILKRMQRGINHKCS